MKRLLFLTSTRADYGKIKRLILETSEAFAVSIFATGMHMLERYGSTANEMTKEGLRYYPYINQDARTPQDRILANTINGLSLYVQENRPDLLVIHGDRVEALAGAIVGNLNGILTAHIEGGELSGTVDGMMRHAVTKLAHVHFCANADAMRRLVQLGEVPATIFPIGSPDVDVMLGVLPAIEEVKKHYGIIYQEYGILIYHPVAGEDAGQFSAVLSAAVMAKFPFIAIYPNNDPGAELIISILDGQSEARLQVFPSMRFEMFLTLLKHARVILGNSSAGIREAPVYGVPTVNVGTRQAGRSALPSIVNVPEDYEQICNALANLPKAEPSLEFGRGDSAKQFLQILSTDKFWGLPTQKGFWEKERI